TMIDATVVPKGLINPTFGATVASIISTLRFRRGEQPQRRRSGGCSPSLASGGSDVGTPVGYGWGCPLSGPPACPCARLLDHLIGQEQQGWGHRDPQRLG